TYTSYIIYISKSIQPTRQRRMEMPYALRVIAAWLCPVALLISGFSAGVPRDVRDHSSEVQRGQRAFTDYHGERAGIFRKITVADLPEPWATVSVDNGPRLVSRPANAWPQAPAGFKVEQYAAGLDNPREIRTAPN